MNGDIENREPDMDISNCLLISDSRLPETQHGYMYMYMYVSLYRSTRAAEGGKGVSNCVKHLLSNYLSAVTIFGRGTLLTEAIQVHRVYSNSIHMWFRIHPYMVKNPLDSGI